MALPAAIEIVPPSAPIVADVTVPGSKSITNRALILAALAKGTVTLKEALWSEDTQVMVNCLRTLGIEIDVAQSAHEPSNRHLTVKGTGGRLAPGGTNGAPLELFVGNAGTAARFLAALVCLGQGFYRLSGVPRMHERPQVSLFESLTDLGYEIDSRNGKLPALFVGAGAKPGRCQVSVGQSSQFASALLLVGHVAGWQIDIVDGNPEQLPYVDMTRALIDNFPHDGGTWVIEPDASSGSYFWGASHALQSRPKTRGSQITVNNWPISGWQIDAEFPRHLPLPVRVSRESDLGDSIMTAIAIAPLSSTPHAFEELGRLRVQECERVQALKDELRKCGAQIEEDGDTLKVTPVAIDCLRGAPIKTYHDHRMAMCLATLALVVPGMVILDPACVSKTFPNFFAKLAAPVPHGLGVTIKDASEGAAGRVLSGDDLLA